MKISAKAMRLGTESAFEVLARVEQLKRQGKDIINLSIGQPDFLTSDNIVEAAVKALRRGMHGYTPAPGLVSLREAVSERYYKEFGISIDPNNVLITPGAKPVLFIVASMLGGDGHEILYPDPGFPIYESVIKFSGSKAVPYPLLEKENFSISARTILDRITKKTRLLILNSPHNPTGSVSNQKELEELIKALIDHPNIGILSDEIYSKMYFDDLRHISIIQYPEVKDRAIILDGWSKTYAMTGWRLGYSIWPDKLIEIATRFAINTHSCVNGFVQIAGVEALKGPQNGIDHMMVAFKKRRNFLVSRLNTIENISCISPKGAFYAFPNIIKTGKSSSKLQYELLEKAGVATLPGVSFGKRGEGFLRISYANSLENIEAAINRIESYLSRQ